MNRETTREWDEKTDARMTYCRRLGHEVGFRYCRTQEGGTLCTRIRDCWWEHFDIDRCLQSRLEPEAWERLRAAGSRPPDRIKTIMEIVNRVKNQS